MKNTFIKFMSLILILSFFAGCTREEFMDIYSFTERFGYSKLNVEDFYFEKNEAEGNYYYTFFEPDNPKIMLKLICTAENRIDELRIYLPKCDENANRKELSTEEISLFTELIVFSIEAYTGLKENTAEEIIEQMQLYEKKSYENEGELTKIKSNYYFVYHSASQGSEFIIYNTYLKDIPQTEKPESKPMYGDTTKIRTETVPKK